MFNNTGVFDLQNDVPIFWNGGNPRFENAGRFTKSGGTGTAVIRVLFNNSGTVEVESGTLHFAAAYTQTAGATILNGGNIATTPALQIQGGVLAGDGSISGNVASSGTVSPGLSLGTINVTGTYTQTTSGLLSIELGGSPACGDFDQLNVGGRATLAGTLRIELIDGCQPILGQNFPIMSYASLTGVFDGVEGVCAGAGIVFELQYGPTALSLVVASSPAPNGDLDFSGRVDLKDVAAFQSCFTGAGGLLSTCCEAADFNRDGSIELNDYPPFAGAMTGP